MQAIDRRKEMIYQKISRSIWNNLRINRNGKRRQISRKPFLKIKNLTICLRLEKFHDAIQETLNCIFWENPPEKLWEVCQSSFFHLEYVILNLWRFSLLPSSIPDATNSIPEQLIQAPTRKIPRYIIVLRQEVNIQLHHWKGIQGSL